MILVGINLSGNSQFVVHNYMTICHICQGFLSIFFNFFINFYISEDIPRLFPFLHSLSLLLYLSCFLCENVNKK